MEAQQQYQMEINSDVNPNLEDTQEENIHTEDSSQSLPSTVAQKASPESYKLSDITPTNLLQQKELFFARDCSSDPQFTYNFQFAPSSISLDTQHLTEALRILNLGTKPKLEPYLSKQDIIQVFNQYVTQMCLSAQVSLSFESNCISRTKVKHTPQKSIVIMRDPPNYTPSILKGVLNHEVGTHILRRINDRKQKHYRHRKKFGLGVCRTDIEEGLAVLNQLLDEEEPTLFIPALRYYSSIMASERPFKEVYQCLLSHLKDESEAWNETLRVKRSLTNTSEKGGFYKDQAYFLGALQILQKRKEIDFPKLFGGKVNIEDVSVIDESLSIKPLFLDSEYATKLDKIAQLNGLP